MKPEPHAEATTPPDLRDPSNDARLARERELLRTTLEHMDQGLLVVGADLSVPVLSRRVAELLALPAAFLEGHPSFPEILRHQYETGTISLETMNSGINSYILNREELPEVHVYERETFDGRTLEVRTTRLPDGGFVRTFTDQTARRSRDAEIARSQAEYRLLFENSVIGIYRATPDGRLLRANPALARLMGYCDEAEMLGAAGAGVERWFVDPARRAAFRRSLEREGHVADFVSEVRRHGSDETFWVSETAWTIRDDVGAIVAYEGTLLDATARKRAGDRISHAARHDGITGLPNRRAFADRLEAALAARAPGGTLAVILFDIDRFKRVNDTFGHPAGDALLRSVAERIAALLGPEDVLSRFGGDEFALLLPTLGAADAEVRARYLLAAAREPFIHEGREIVASTSVGIALAPKDGDDPSALLRAADLALYAAKGAGRARFARFDAAMDAAARDHARLETDLRAALDGQGFSLRYQPVVDLAGGPPAGYEALLRWTHPARGAVAPDAFIPLAEETGAIVRIGEWALAEACAAAARWPHPTPVWVNVSPVQLAHSDFEAAVARTLSATGLAPARLVLEVTETALVADWAALAPQLERLRARGLRLALDDFGAGYSSLDYLRRFRFDVLKLDRSFVAGIADPATAAIVASVLDLGRRLGLLVVAEGVETAAQLETLRGLGCAFVQGRLVGPPVDNAAIDC